MRREIEPVLMVTTTGRTDRKLADAVVWASRRTWLGRTRWLPQNVVTLCAMAYFVASLAWAWVDGWHGPATVLNVVATGALCATLEWFSARTRGLSELPPTAGAMRSASSIAGMRFYMVVVSVPFLLGPAIAPGAKGALDCAMGVVWMLGLYTVTMGRPHPPARKARRRVAVRLPRLAALGGRA